MPVINILSPHVADMIAAGEVVERPASVIKELIENSFDAGARNINIEIHDGGATFIRISDDGCGMAPEDAGVAFLRHATSKLSDERGLEAISTMGFRGEALAAISSVSDIELLTRQKNSAEGTIVTLRAGDIQDMGAAGCPEGTVITVSKLFYNTPARLKFLKSDRSEASACVSAALRCALGHPEVSVRFIRDGNEEFFSPGDSRMDSCIYTLLGRDTASSMLRCESEHEGIHVSGYVSSPSAGRGNRSAQFFYCNGRYIRSVLLQTAVEQAYKNTLLTGRYPACVLYLDISCAAVDVNVHPAKTEVKFSQERAVFDLVYNAVRSALEGENRGFSTDTPAQDSAPAPMPSRVRAGTPAPAVRAIESKPRDDFYRSMSAKDFRESGFTIPARPTKMPPHETPSLRAADLPYQTGIEMPKPVAETPVLASSPVKSSTERSFPDIIVENPVQNVERPTVPDHKIVGEVLKTYIIVECGEELILIDKHAAHERIIFDRLKNQEREIMSQSLLSPVTVRLSGEDAELLENNAELLTGLGFELEPFGGSNYILRAVPADMFAEDAINAIEEICDTLKTGSAPDKAAARDTILHTVACKAAIKAGWDTSPAELERIAETVLSESIRYCPHGRPVSVKITHRELDKLFKRIV